MAKLRQKVLHDKKLPTSQSAQNREKMKL